MCLRYMCIVLYIERDAITCAKFGVAVFKASMLNCKQSNVPWVYLHHAINETYLVQCFAQIYACLEGVNLP